jgi:PAS domain S-box-containing protein
MRAGRWGGAIRARLLALVAVPCVILMTIWHLWTSYSDVLDDSEVLTTALSRVAEEHVSGIMRSMDLVMAEIMELADPQGRIDPQAFANLMKGRMRQLHFIRNAYTTNAAGIVQVGTMLTLPGLDNHDRDYFAVPAKDPSVSFFVSTPLKSRAAPVVSIIISRPMRNAKGEFLGVVAMAIDPRLLEDELRSVQPLKGGYATLIRGDGIILARVPGEEMVGKSVAEGQVMRAMLESRSGVLRGRGATGDGAERIVSYRTMADYPLVVAVGVRTDAVLAAWRTAAILQGGVAAVVTGLLIWLALLTDRSLKGREAAQAALSLSEARFRGLSDRSPLGVIQTTRDGICLYVNDRWLELSGLSREAAIGAKWCDMVEPAEREVIAEAWYRLVRAGAEFSREMRLRRPDGRVIWLQGHASPLGQAGEDAGLVATFQDISDAKEVEGRLRLSEEKFAKAFLGSPDALVISTIEQGAYVEVNDAFCRLLGYSRAEFMGNDALSLGVWADLADRARLVAEVKSKGQVDGFETVLRRKDGRTMIVLISVQRINVAGEPCLLFICRDVSEQRAMEARSRELMAKLDASNKELEQFAYVTSHDLQEPLRMIASYAQLIERRYRGRLDQDADEFISYLVDGAKRMQAMIQDLLEYSRVERLGGAFARFSADKALEDVRHNLSLVINETGATIEIGPLPDVVADRSQFVRLMQNLVGNALKYRHPDRVPHISVTAQPDGTSWIFSVADNGIGIDPQYFERIFLVFQRLHTRDAYPGTGIGLAVCKRIAERHGGRLWVDSVPGQGSDFRFTLPSLPESASEAA